MAPKPSRTLKATSVSFMPTLKLSTAVDGAVPEKT
jgi:hypothetical protein